MTAAEAHATAPPEPVVKEEEGAVSTHDDVPAAAPHAYATRGSGSVGQ